MMFEFSKTDKGWLVFWGFRPLEPQQAELAVPASLLEPRISNSTSGQSPDSVESSGCSTSESHRGQDASA